MGWPLGPATASYLMAVFEALAGVSATMVVRRVAAS